MSERRSAQRCPVCQGPASEAKNYPEGLRCRVSICIHNHADVECPRCETKDLEGVRYHEGRYHYTCRECTNAWERTG